MEIVQSLVLDPALLILDEIDSGLDVDALRIVAGKFKHGKPAQKKVFSLLRTTPGF